MGVDGLVVMRQNAFPASEDGVDRVLHRSCARGRHPDRALYESDAARQRFLDREPRHALARAEHPLHQRCDRRYGPHPHADQPARRQARSVQRLGAHPGVRVSCWAASAGWPGRHASSRRRRPNSTGACNRATCRARSRCSGRCGASTNASANIRWRRASRRRCNCAAMRSAIRSGRSARSVRPPARKSPPRLRDADRALAEARRAAMNATETDAVRELRRELGDRAVRSAPSDIVRFLRDNSWLSPVLAQELERRSESDGAGARRAGRRDAGERGGRRARSRRSRRGIVCR